MKKIFVGARVAAQAASRLSSSVLAVIAFAAMVLAACGTAPAAKAGPTAAAGPAAIPSLPEGGYTGRGLDDREIALWWFKYRLSLARSDYERAVFTNNPEAVVNPERSVIPDVELASPELSSPKPDAQDAQEADREKIEATSGFGFGQALQKARATAPRIEIIIAQGIPVRVTSVAKERFLNMRDEARTPLTPKTIDIGENIAIEKGASDYIDSFIDVYNGGGKKAGSYSYSGGAWKMTLVF
jgi:hypothetical protein